MAKIPYTSEIGKQISTDLATRLQQFLQIEKLIEAMSVVNNTPQNTKEIKAFGDEVSALYTDYMNNKLSDDQVKKANTVFADEELMETADKIAESTDSAEKINLARLYTAKKMTDIALREGGYTKIGDGKDINTALNLTGVLFMILEKESKKINSEEFADRIVKGEFHSDELPLAVNTLQAARQKVMERLRTDWQTYKDTRAQNPNIDNEVFENLLSDKKEFHYKTYPELHNVLLCVRDDFNAKDTGSKPMFLKMVGNMLDCGQNQVNNQLSSAARRATAYSNFIGLIKQQYPENSDEVINTLLDINAENASKDVEKLRHEAFEKKSKELYCKFVSAVLVKKFEANEKEHRYNFDYQKYVESNIADYIAGMKNGENNIAANLHLVEESNAKSLKELIDDTAEHQVISVHHKVPVAAAVPLYVETHPELFKDKQKISEFIGELKKICPSAVENRTEKDLMIIGLGLAVFQEESRKDKPSEIMNISDEKKRAKAIQTLTHKNKIHEIYQKYFPLSGAETAKIREEILRIVNDPSNHMLPIGNDVHQKSEPNGNMAMIKQNDQIVSIIENISNLTGIKTTEKVSDTAIFAAQYDKSKFNEVVKKLKTPLREALEQYNKSEGSTLIQRALLKLPETSFIQKVRSILNSNQIGLSMDSMRKTIGLTK